MSMSNDQAKETIVNGRRRKEKETEEVVANVVASSAQQVRARNIDYAISRVDLTKDLGETTQRLAHTRVHENTFDAARKENNYSMKETRPRVWLNHLKPSITVHPSKMIGPSRFSPNYNQNMQRTLVSTPRNFSFMKLLMGDENTSTLTDEELHILLSTDQSLSSEGQRVQQSPNSQVRNYQNIRRTQESTTSNFSYMKLLMEGEESSTLTNDIYEKQPLSTQYSLSSEGKRVQQLPVSQAGYYQYGNSSAGHMMQQFPCNQVENDKFDNSLQETNLQDRQNQVLPQTQEISFRELLARDDISYMDLLTREDLYISWT